MKQELTDTLRRLVDASVVIGNLPEWPGYNGTVLQIDDEEAERIASDLSDAAATIEKAQALLEATAAEIAALKKENEAFKAVTTTWMDAATDFRDAVLHGLDGLDNDQTNTVLSAFDEFLPI